MVAQERLNLYRTGPCQQLPEALVSRDGGEKMWVVTGQLVGTTGVKFQASKRNCEMEGIERPEGLKGRQVVCDERDG